MMVQEGEPFAGDGDGDAGDQAQLLRLPEDQPPTTTLRTTRTRPSEEAGHGDTRMPSLRFISARDRAKWTPEQRAHYKESYSRGSFTRHERERINLALQDYQRHHRLGGEEELHALINPKTARGKDIAGGTQARIFYREILANSGINRSMDQLYFYLVRKYWSVVREGERWTPEEDARLRDLVALRGERWEEIRATLVKADPRSRWIKLKRADREEIRAGKWEDAETLAFIRHLLFLLHRDGVHECRTFHSWTELSLLLGTRDELQCRTHWTQVVRRAASEINEVAAWMGKMEELGSPPVMDDEHQFVVDPPVSIEALLAALGKITWTAQTDLELVERLMILCEYATDESDIIWSSITSENDSWRGPNPSELRARWMRMCSNIPPYAAETFQERLQYCHAHIHEVSVDLNSLSQDLVPESGDEWGDMGA